MQDILLRFLMFLLKTLSNIFIAPIMALIEVFIPSVTQFVTVCQTFLNNYVFTGAGFVKQVFVNCTGVSQTILIALFTYLTAKVTLYIGMLAVKLAMKVWRLVKP